jgi:hypothetical protein
MCRRGLIFAFKCMPCKTRMHAPARVRHGKFWLPYNPLKTFRQRKLTNQWVIIVLGLLGVTLRQITKSVRPWWWCGVALHDARIYLWKNGASNYAADEHFHTIFTTSIFYKRQQQLVIGSKWLKSKDGFPTLVWALVSLVATVTHWSAEIQRNGR